MSHPEFFATKYDAALVTCNLWLRAKGPLSLSETPNDTVTVNLKADSSVPKFFKLSGRAGQDTLEYRITILTIDIVNGTHRDPYGSEFAYTNSPSIALKFESDWRTATRSGMNSGWDSGDSGLSENISSTFVARSQKPVGSVGATTVHYVACFLETKAKPEFLGQWKQVAPGNQPNCLLTDSGPPSICMITK